MTARDRADRSLALSKRISEYLAAAGRPMDAGRLLRDFCKKNDVPLADAEVALSILLNQRAVMVDSEMRLERKDRVAA